MSGIEETDDRDEIIDRLESSSQASFSKKPCDSESGSLEKCWGCGKPAVVREYLFDDIWQWSCKKCALT